MLPTSRDISDAALLPLLISSDRRSRNLFHASLTALPAQVLEGMRMDMTHVAESLATTMRAHASDSGKPCVPSNLGDSHW